MITLAEYKNAFPEAKWDVNAIIDEFRVQSVIFNELMFDNTVVPTGGSAFVYAYDRVVAPSAAAFRAVGGTYNVATAKAQKQTAEVKILGTKFTIDRAIAIASEDSFYDQGSFQAAQAVKSVVATFNNAMINGDATTNANEFDGLDKMLTGTDTEVTSAVDLSTSALVDANATAFIDEVDALIGAMDGEPSMIFLNNVSMAKFKAVARRLSQYQETKDDIGRTIVKYGNAILVDLGSVPGSASPIIPIDGTKGTTDIYFVRLGQDGFHGITLKNKIIDVILPEYSETPSEVITGLVESYLGVVLKSTKAAAVLRGVKVR
jgi:hypothetical protein